MAKGMTLQEAIDKAPDWATHISVSKYTGVPEYYNTGPEQVLSVGVRTPDEGPAELGEAFGSRLFSGQTQWYVIPIKPVSLLNE